MNGANRPRKRVSYKKRAYRRRKIKYIIVISLIVILALFVVFLVVGSILDRKVESTLASIDELNGESKPSQDTSDTPHGVPESVYVEATYLSAQGSTLDARLSAIKANGSKAACFALDGKDGELLYLSPTAQKLGYQSADTELWHLENAIAKFDENGLHSVGITYCSELDDDNDLKRSAAIGYHAALIAEALRAGVDEVLIIAPSNAPERLSELIRLADEVHRLVPDGKVGISLSYPLPEYPNATEEFSDKLLTELWGSFDFFALDVCSDGAEVSVTETRLGELLYYILRYNMRILIPSGNTALAEACEQRGFDNVQFMP